MSRSIATTDRVERADLLDFLRTRHRVLLATSRPSDGRPQLSPVSAGIDEQGRVVIATYPARAKTRNAEADERVSALFLSDEFNGPWVQVDGRAEVLHMPQAGDGLVAYYRANAGEHPDWDEYREAMAVQDKSLVRITIERWGPIATGGFPPGVAQRLDG